MTKTNKAITPYENIQRYIRSEAIVDRFREIVGNSDALVYVNSVLLAVQASDKLQQCNPISIVRAAAQAATLRLSCDPILGQAYLVPYGNQATMIPGYKGYLTLTKRTGNVFRFQVSKLYQGQEWIENQLTGQAHIGGMKTSDQIIGYFAYLEEFNGCISTRYMTVDEIHKHKEKYAPGWRRKESCWNTEFEKMAMKTVVRQLLPQTGLMDLVGQLEKAENTYLDDLPKPEEVTPYIEGEKHSGKSTKQLNKELGFDDDPVVEGQFKEDKKSPNNTIIRKPNELQEWFDKQFNTLKDDADYKIDKAKLARVVEKFFPGKKSPSVCRNSVYGFFTGKPGNQITDKEYFIIAEFAASENAPPEANMILDYQNKADNQSNSQEQLL